MLYQINNGAVAFADNVILHTINFEIRNTEKIAVVGRNGCGKTTLLKLISGEVDLDKLDSDEDSFIAKAGNPQIGYLKQIAFDDPDITLEKEVRKCFDKMVTYGKSGSLVSRRLALAFLHNDNEVVQKVFNDLAKRYENRAGGYTRIIKLNERRGDEALEVKLELV